MNTINNIVLVSVLSFQAMLYAMDLEKSDTNIGIFSIEIWENIAIQMFPKAIGTSKAIIESSGQIAQLTTGNKNLQSIFNQEWIKNRILRRCDSNLSIYGAYKKAKENNCNRGLVMGAIVDALKDIEDFNKIIDNPERTEEQIEYIKKCIARWNVEMEIWYYPEGSSSLHLGGSFLNQISKLNNSSLIKDLIDCGVDARKKNHCDYTPFEVAVKNRCFEAAKLLFKFEDTLFNHDELFFCQDNKHFESFFSFIKDLIENHVFSVDAPIVNFQEKTPILTCNVNLPLLFAAFFHDNEELIRYLVDNGANPDAKAVITYQSNSNKKISAEKTESLRGLVEQVKGRKKKKTICKRDMTL